MINWFPGHMNKTLKQMQSDSKLCNCFVYVLDARCPKSCLNPEFVKVTKDKPIIFVLNKADLVSQADNQKNISYFKTLGADCLTVNAVKSGNAKSIISSIKNIFKSRLEENKLKGVNFIIRCMVIGVPNSGKSTIVNNLCGSGRAVTGNKAGVTKNKLWVKVDGNIEFMDTPGVLLPTMDNEDLAYNLAIVGSVKDDVLDLTTVACKLIGKLREKNLSNLNGKYGVCINQDLQDNEILSLIAKKRGCILKGGEIDFERASKLILTDFRSGKLGQICLE